MFTPHCAFRFAAQFECNLLLASSPFASVQYYMFTSLGERGTMGLSTSKHSIALMPRHANYSRRHPSIRTTRPPCGYKRKGCSPPFEQKPSDPALLYHVRHLHCLFCFCSCFGLVAGWGRASGGPADSLHPCVIFIATLLLVV